MSFYELARQQRAHRQFRTDAVDDATIEQLVRAAVHAPSAENSQPWEFVIVRDDRTRGAITDLMTQAWNHGGEAWSAPRLAPSLFGDVDRGMRGGFGRAPVLIVAAADTRRTHEHTVAASLFPAIQNLLLAATELGLASALTTIATAFQSELRALLALPPQIVVVAVIPVGWPLTPLGPSRREAATARMHRDRFGVSWSSANASTPGEHQ